MPRVISLALVLCLAACASMPPAQLSLPELRLVPAAMAMDISLAQRLSFDRGAQQAVSPVIDAQLEIDADAIRFAGFAAGQRMLTFTWDGRRLAQQRSPQLPEHVRAEPILRDIQLVHAPIDLLRAALPEGWTVDGTSTSRELSYRGGVAVAIEYKATVILDNRIEHYRLTIESTDADASEPTP